MLSSRRFLEKIKNEEVLVFYNERHEALLSKKDDVLFLYRKVFENLRDECLYDFWNYVKIRFKQISIVDGNLNSVLLDLRENHKDFYYIPVIYGDHFVDDGIGYTERSGRNRGMENVFTDYEAFPDFLTLDGIKDYFGLFSSPELVRQFFTPQYYSVLEIAYEDIFDYYKGNDVVVEPGVFDLIIPAELLTGIKSITFFPKR